MVSILENVFADISESHCTHLGLLFTHIEENENLSATLSIRDEQVLICRAGPLAALCGHRDLRLQQQQQTSNNHLTLFRKSEMLL